MQPAAFAQAGTTTDEAACAQLGAITDVHALFNHGMRPDLDLVEVRVDAVTDHGRGMNAGAPGASWLEAKTFGHRFKGDGGIFDSHTDDVFGNWSSPRA